MFDGTWGYDFGFRYSQVKATSTSPWSQPRVSIKFSTRTIPSSSQVASLEGESAFNPFGDALGPPIPANAASTEFAIVHPKDVDTSKLGTLDLNIYTTELFKLPAGGIGFAFGGQFRKETLEQDIDQLT